MHIESLFPPPKMVNLDNYYFHLCLSMLFNIIGFPSATYPPPPLQTWEDGSKCLNYIAQFGNDGAPHYLPLLFFILHAENTGLKVLK